ncbi:MAG: hypothetical protein ABIT38_08695, partial [Gemmatimonadaceae bacterium]
PDAPIETHEEAAEAFLTLSVIVLGIAALGLRSGRISGAARVLGTVGAVALLGAGWRVSHSGGALVYRYGAASAYTDAPGQHAPAGRAAAPKPRDGSEYRDAGFADQTSPASLAARRDGENKR